LFKEWEGEHIKKREREAEEEELEEVNNNNKKQRRQGAQRECIQLSTSTQQT